LKWVLQHRTKTLLVIGLLFLLSLAIIPLGFIGTEFLPQQDIPFMMMNIKMPVPAAQEELPTELRAPMPGVIIEISVPPGAYVARGDQLLVLEAMKMKNPIRSPRDGVVDAIHIQTGQSVNFDDLLLSYREG
jgi:acetyl/propionyl-CoA carboxylase alpha subunit